MKSLIRLLLVLMMLTPFALQANEPVSQDEGGTQSAETGDKKTDKSEGKKKKPSGDTEEEPDCE